VDDAVVLDHAGLDDGVEAHLGDPPLEAALGVGEDVEHYGLVGHHAGDEGLVDLGLDLHALEVSRDDEEDGGLEAGRHGLPHVDVAGDHHAVDGSEDAGVAKVYLGQRKGAPALAHRGGAHAFLRPGGFQRELCGVEVTV